MNQPAQETVSSPSATEQIPKKPNWLAFGLISVFLLLVLGMIGYLYVSSRAKEEPKKNPTRVSTNNALVNITKNGFEPQTISIKEGTTVVWTNTDTEAHQVASDPHPTHTQLKELGDGEALAKEEKFSFIFEKKGSFTFHDHLNPLKFKGTVVVE